MSASREYFGTYAEHTRVLRTWLVAYGVGGPVLILTNDKILLKVSGAPDASSIALLFGVGVAAQVLIAFINKVALWGVYYGEENE